MHCPQVYGCARRLLEQNCEVDTIADRDGLLIMLLGASTFIWTSPFGDDKLYLARHAADLGFDFLEICIEDPALVDPSAVRQASSEAGVGLSLCGVFGPDRDISHQDLEGRRKGLDYLKQCIDIAADAGASNVVGPMYSAVGKTRLLPENEREQQRLWAIDGLHQAGRYAASRGVGLAIEPLNRFETDLVNTVEQGLDLCRRIGLDNVGLLLDTFHMNIEERSLPAAIRAAGGRLRHFHACENDRGAPGNGHIEWDGVFAALRDIKYDGFVAIEAFTPEIKGIARAVSMWRPVASSPDDLARDGLKFLKQNVY
jgi:D-psicose/D-tagatose/L-ribulose 3-epimerase